MIFHLLFFLLLFLFLIQLNLKSVVWVDTKVFPSQARDLISPVSFVLDLPTSHLPAGYAPKNLT